MTAYEGEIENSKYKLLGFENDKCLAVIMIIATGKIIRVKLSEVLNSEIMDNLNKMEIKNLYKKFYSQGGAVTAYDLNDRNENSWMIYIILNLLLFTFYIFTSIAATKPIYIESLDIIVTPGTFLYPLTFLIVDLLNENFGLRLARKAILFAFASNAMIIILLYGSTFLPDSARLEARWALQRSDRAGVIGIDRVVGVVPGVGEHQLVFAVQDQRADQLQVLVLAHLPQHVLCGDYRQLPVLFYRVLWRHADQRHCEHDLRADRDQSRFCVLQHLAGLWRTFIIQTLPDQRHCVIGRCLASLQLPKQLP